MTQFHSPSSESVRGVRILVVEDEPSLRDVLAHYLRRRGYEVDTANHGDDGLEKIAKAAQDPTTAFELLITDMNMPHIGGLELIQIVRGRQFRIKIIACSSAFTTESLEALRKLSIDATLPKFSLTETLLEAVDRLTRPGPSSSHFSA